MAQYPKTYAGIAGLATTMVAGFTEFANIFTHADPAALQQAIDQYNNADNALAEAKEQLAAAAADKRGKLDQLQSQIKQQIKQAEIDCVDDPSKLTQIGWGPRSKSKGIEIELPHKVVDLRVAAQTDTTVFLEWRKVSKSGGPVKCYNIERRQATDNDFSDWQLAATALDTKWKLTDQPVGCKLQYRVKAINKAGESIPSEKVVAIV